MKSFLAATLALAVAFGTAGSLSFSVEATPACSAPAPDCCPHHAANQGPQPAKSPCESCPVCAINCCALPALTGETVASPATSALRWRSLAERGPERSDPPPLPPPRSERVS